jgi:hypothetical protein
MPSEVAKSLSAESWRLEWLDCQRLEPTLAVASGRAIPGYEYRTREDTFFLKPHDHVARLTSARGQTIVLPAQSLFHIEQTHLAPVVTSHFTDRVSVGWLLRELARRLPDEIIYADREARLEFSDEHPVGNDIVAARSDLVATGRLSAWDSTAIEPFRQAVFELNLLGAKTELPVFAANANQALAGTSASFGFRRGAIVAQHSIPPALTNWYSLVVYRDASGGGPASEVGEIRTIYPGRVREPFPAGRWFFARYGADRTSRGLEIHDRLVAGQPLKKTYQRQAAQAQRRAQEFWWEHVLLEAPTDAERWG